MKNIFFTCSLVLACLSLNAQYKYDNQKFKTVYPEDLCKTLKNNPGYLLLDVRSQGEFYDTSRYAGSNIGRLKGAKNIDVRELPNRLIEISTSKDKPVFIYCSHSQRSRRASRLLSDSGFTHVFNINSGLTGFRLQNLEKGCSAYELESHIDYNIVTPSGIEKRNYYIVDLRDDSVFNGTTINEGLKARGKIAGAINIPWKNFNNNWQSIPLNKNILLVDDFGDVSPKAAKLLKEKGSKRVSVLFGGIDELAEYRNENGAPSELWQYATDYYFLTADEFDKYMRTKPAVTIVDTRSKEEFKNTYKDSYRNIGNIINAVNIPADEIEGMTNFPMDKNSEIILYSFSNGNVFEAARELRKKGFTNVEVLLGGIFSLRWQAANLKDKSHLADWVVNVPEENM